MGHHGSSLGSLHDDQNMEKRISEHISEHALRNDKNWVARSKAQGQAVLPHSAAHHLPVQLQTGGTRKANSMATPCVNCVYNLNLSYLSFMEFLNRYEASLSLLVYTLHPENLLTSFDMFSFFN